jgi:hypothetical protein
VKFDPEYPFAYDDCTHNKFYTDPENIGVCKECMALNMAVSDDQELDDDILDKTYAIMGALMALSEALENEE